MKQDMDVFLQWLTSQERWTENIRKLYIIIMYDKMLLTAYTDQHVMIMYQHAGVRTGSQRRCNF